MTKSELEGYNHGRSLGGLPPIKPYRAWQIKMFYGLMILFYATLSFLWLSNERLDPDSKYLIGVGSGLNAVAYLFLYFDQRKNNLIILCAVALITGLFNWLIPVITLFLTLAMQLIRWNSKRSEWSQMWFES